MWISLKQVDEHDNARPKKYQTPHYCTYIPNMKKKLPPIIIAMIHNIAETYC